MKIIGRHGEKQCECALRSFWTSRCRLLVFLPGISCEKFVSLQIQGELL